MINLYLVISLTLFISGISIVLVTIKSLPSIKFSYPVAKYETIGNPFIHERNLNQLIESSSLNSFKTMVNSYRDYDVNGEDAKDIQRSLDFHLVSSISMIRNDSPKELEDFYESFLSFLDRYSIKMTVKSKISGRDTDIISYSDRNKYIINAIKSADKDDITKILDGFGISIDPNADPLIIDSKIDRYFLEKLREVKVPKVAREIKMEFVGRLYDIINIRNVISSKNQNLDRMCNDIYVGDGWEISDWRYRDLCRSRNMDEIVSALEGTSYYNFIKQGVEESKRQGTIQPIENSLDVYLIKLCGDLSLKNFPFFGPLLKFTVSKNIEIRNLKVIVKGIEEGLSKDRIKSLLIVSGD